MTQVNTNYQDSKLWKLAFEENQTDSNSEEREVLRVTYKKMRKKVSLLLSRIPVDMKEFTVHDISHVDSLWSIASDVIADNLEFNPTEAFVFGASALLHDAGMSTYAYKNGLTELKERNEYKDQLVFEHRKCEEVKKSFDLFDPPEEIVKKVVPIVLRRLHAQQAENLATDSWSTSDDSAEFLIDDPVIRNVYGSVIGKIAKSHGFPIDALENEIKPKLNSWKDIPTSSVETIKIACLLRIADALHIDSGRAPQFLHKILDLDNESNKHFNFQKRISRFEIEDNAVVYRSGPAFEKKVSDAWWLAHDTIVKIDQELKEVNEFMECKGKKIFRINRIKGVESPEELAKYIEPKGWSPVDIKLRISDVESIIKKFGGIELYGNDQMVVFRELIQNATDAIRTRCLREKKNYSDWGCIRIGLRKEGRKSCFFIEDNGIGMSRRILTGALLDFGKSFWQSREVLDEFPGLLASGLNTIGKYGIGFFSVFLLGSTVRVYSRRFDVAKDNGYLLEFHDGIGMKPILSNCDADKLPVDGGTRVEILIDNVRDSENSKIKIEINNVLYSLKQIVGFLAPNIEIEIKLDEYGKKNTIPADWKNLDAIKLLDRVSIEKKKHPLFEMLGKKIDENEKDLYRKLMQPLVDEKNNYYGRALIDLKDGPTYYKGCVSSQGIRVCSIGKLSGIIFGKVETIDRKKASLNIPKDVLTKWSTKQAELISSCIEDYPRQAKSAEVVLWCGGDIGNLKIINVGTDWYSEEEFYKFLKKNNKIYIIPEDFLQYDEYYDDVKEWEFIQKFTLNENVSYITNFNGSLTSDDHYNYFEFHIEDSWEGEFETHLTAKIFEIIEAVWGDKIVKKYETYKIGYLNKSDIQISRKTLVIERN